MSSAAHLPDRYGGAWADPDVGPVTSEALRGASRDWPSIVLSGGAAAVAEMLVVGGFAPLTGFMVRAEVEAVRADGRLPGGLPWPTPITLRAPSEVGEALTVGESVALRSPEGVMVAALSVEDVWAEGEVWFVGGPLQALGAPLHYDFRALRGGPRQLREAFAQRGWRRTLAYQPPAVVDAVEHEALLAAARAAHVNLLIHAPVGAVDTADQRHYARVRALQAAMGRFVAATTHLALLAYAPRDDGAEEALMRAIVARNFGCTHVALPADLPGELLRAHAAEVGVEIVAGPPARDPWGDDAGPPGGFPEVRRELERVRRPRATRGFTVFFTGLSGAGKSTVANVLLTRLLERGGRPVTLLDGDIVRRNLSSELGFSKAHRDINVRRIGYVASEITRNGGAAICAPIAPYDEVRRQVRAMIAPHGGFFLVHVATPLEVCERRDRKGLYAKARA